MALANSLPVFVSGSVLYGLTNFVLVPLNSYVTAARGRVSVGRALTLISASFNLGAVLGPLLGGLIGDLFGIRRSFLIAAFLFIISTGLVFFIRAQPVDQGEEDISLRALRNVLHPRFVRYLLIVLMVMFVLYLPQPLSPNFLQNERGVSLTQFGQLAAVTGLGVVVLNLALGQLNSRLGFILAQAAMALFALFLWRGQSLLWYFPAYFLLGSYRTAHSLVVAQSRSLIKARNMGVAYGWVETAASTAIILAPPLAGWLYSLQPALVYPVSLVLIGVAILITMLATPLRAEEIL
jgi:predicted MFS family arabinose efflux permease